MMENIVTKTMGMCQSRKFYNGNHCLCIIGDKLTITDMDKVEKFTQCYYTMESQLVPATPSLPGSM